MSVKDILQSLVDDNLVYTFPLFSTSCVNVKVFSDKIGTSIYYWSFPSDARRSRKAKIEILVRELEMLRQRQINVQTLVEEAFGVRQDNVRVTSIDDP